MKRLTEGANRTSYDLKCDVVCNDKRYTIKIEWRDWQKELIGQVMIWHLMLFAMTKDVISRLNEEADWRSSLDKWWFDNYQRSLLHFRAQPFMVVCNAKHVHNFLWMSDKFNDPNSWKHVGFFFFYRNRLFGK